MDNDLAVTIGLLGGTFTLFTAVMKLHQEMEERRDIALGLTKDSQFLAKDLRLYILHKDVIERLAAIALLLGLVGIITIGAAIYILESSKTVDMYLTAILSFFGLSCSIAGFHVGRDWFSGLRQLETFINTGSFDKQEPDGATIKEGQV